MDFTLSGVLGVIETGVPPEIMHFRKGTHPGKNWWLKTVVPLQQDTRITSIWMHISRMHPALVLLTPTAYDWYGEIISGFQSVWIKENLDLELLVKKRIFDYNIVSFAEGFNNSGQKLQKIVESHQATMPHLCSDDEWSELSTVTEFMSAWTTDAQARQKRKTLRKLELDDDKE